MGIRNDNIEWTPVNKDKYTPDMIRKIDRNELHYSEARFYPNVKGDYPELRADMYKSLVKVRQGIRAENPNSNKDFTITSARRDSGGHIYSTAADIVPTNGLTYTELANAIKKYGDGLDGIPHLNSKNGQFRDGRILPQKLDALPSV
ncbi:MAG: hypothetical protein LBK53_09245 [Heliobacteriaceae bacterium]|jgi:hypothetical protein|nr:hypothetical protein [Heliobacteriaceae bacterium]